MQAARCKLCGQVVRAGPLTKDELAVAQEMRADGLALADIARRIGCSPASVHAAEARGFSALDPPRWARLPPATVRLLRALYANGCHETDAANLLGIYTRSARWWRVHVEAE